MDDTSSSASIPPWRVAICRDEPSYPELAPYHPGAAYPELSCLGAPVASAPNPTFGAVREALRLLGCDEARYGTSQWNPLTAWVRPGDRVLVKPNWVMDRHPAEGRLGVETAHACLVTHTSVLRAVIDYVQIALRGEGRIIIADAPLQGCDFDVLLQRGCVPQLIDHYDRLSARRAPRGFSPLSVEVKDLRLEVATVRSGLGRIARTLEKEIRDETIEHRVVRLDEYSSLEPISADWERFRVTSYDPDGMRRAHRPGFHAYCVSREVLEADAVIDVPKLKTHKKGGITVALKNLVGINGHKSFLPHHRLGSVADGGDEYLAEDRLKYLASLMHDTANRRVGPRRQRFAGLAASGLAAIGRLIREEGTESGCWYGNDTIWRTCLDLNRILLFADQNGTFRGTDPTSTPRRRVFHVVDGIVGGEGDGPLAPDPRPSGVVLAGPSAPYVDLAAALVMGLAWQRIPLVSEAFGSFLGAPLVPGEPKRLRITSNNRAWDGFRMDQCDGRLPESLCYRPAPGWEAILDDTDGSETRLPIWAAVRRPGFLWERLARRHSPR